MNQKKDLEPTWPDVLGDGFIHREHPEWGIGMGGYREITLGRPLRYYFLTYKRVPGLQTDSSLIGWWYGEIDRTKLCCVFRLPKKYRSGKWQPKVERKEVPE